MPTPPPTRRQAFTLVEMLIAISLGLVIILTATAGLRVAAQTVTVANRLAIENELIRGGFQIALDEVDFWRVYDDPQDPTRTRQRDAGMIFCPFAGSVLGVDPTPSDPGPIIASSATPPTNDAERGWDASYRWPVADPRCWWRGNMAEQHNSDLRCGAYNRFFSTQSGRGTYTWLGNQMDGLKQVLGYYGMADYLPSGTILDYCRPPGSGTNAGGLLLELTNTNSSFRNGDGGTRFPQGLYRTTKNTAFALFPLAPSVRSNYTVDTRRFFNVGQGASVGDMSDFQARTLNQDQVLPVRPAHWPALTVAVARTLSYTRYACVCRVRWTSPLTGSAAELSFTAFGTSLRGARQQRRPGGTGSAPGWAAWHAAGSPRNSPTLDGD